MSEQSTDTARTSPQVRHLATVSAGFAGLVALLLLASGVGLPMLGSGVGRRGIETPLQRPLMEFEKDQEFLDYRWREVPLDDKTQKILGATAYINRRGFRGRDRSGIDFYATYFGESRTLVEHEPEVCYDSSGWSLPFGKETATIPLTEPLSDGSLELPVNVYLFELDVAHQLLVNTYCVDGRYTTSRDQIREWGETGTYYAQVRIVITLNDYEWAQLRAAPGGPESVFELAANTDSVRGSLMQLEADRRDGIRVRRHPYYRIAEVMSYVVPRLQAEYWPIVDAAADQSPKP